MKKLLVKVLTLSMVILCIPFTGCTPDEEFDWQAIMDSMEDDAPKTSSLDGTWQAGDNSTLYGTSIVHTLQIEGNSAMYKTIKGSGYRFSVNINHTFNIMSFIDGEGIEIWSMEFELMDNGQLRLRNGSGIGTQSPGAYTKTMNWLPGSLTMDKKR